MADGFRGRLTMERASSTRFVNPAPVDREELTWGQLCSWLAILFLLVAMIFPWWTSANGRISGIGPLFITERMAYPNTCCETNVKTWLEFPTGIVGLLMVASGMAILALVALLVGKEFLWSRAPLDQAVRLNAVLATSSFGGTLVLCVGVSYLGAAIGLPWVDGTVGQVAWTWGWGKSAMIVSSLLLAVATVSSIRTLTHHAQWKALGASPIIAPRR